METQDPQGALHNVQKGWRTRQEKEEIIQQWQQSGKAGENSARIIKSAITAW